MNTRIQFELSEERAQELEKLMDEVGVTTRRDLFNNALTIFEWAVKEKKAGRVVASIDESNHRYKELVMPSLASVKIVRPKGEENAELPDRQSNYNEKDEEGVVAAFASGG